MCGVLIHSWCPRARPWVQWKVRESWVMVSDIYNSAMKLVEGASDIQLYHGGGGGRFSDIHYSSMVEGVPWWRWGSGWYGSLCLTRMLRPHALLTPPKPTSTPQTHQNIERPNMHCHKIEIFQKTFLHKMNYTIFAFSNNMTWGVTDMNSAFHIRTSHLRNFSLEICHFYVQNELSVLRICLVYSFGVASVNSIICV